MHRQESRFAVVAAIVALPLLALRAGSLVLDDPLQGSTKGVRSGGTFTEGGWKVTGQYDCIRWRVPAIPRGAVEWEVRGLNPVERRAGMEDKTEIFHLYDPTFGDSDANYVGGYRDNPTKHFVRKIGAAGGATDAMELVWKIGDRHVEPDTSVLDWDPARTYRFREEWGPEGSDSVIRTYRDGALIATLSVPGPFAPAGLSVRIAASPRRSPDAGAPVGAVFAGVKVWDLAGGIPGAPAVTEPSSGETVRWRRALVRWRGDPHDRYRLVIAGTDAPDTEIVWDSGEVMSPRDFAWTGDLPDRDGYRIFVRLGGRGGWGAWSPGGHRLRVDATGTPPAGGPVRVLGTSLADRGGPFLGLGATYMQALWRCKFDRPRLESDLTFLAAQGFGYVRVLSMVGWYPAWKGREIAPVAFTSRPGEAVAAWPDYRGQLRDLLDRVAAHGMRTEMTIFADAQLMPSKADRLAHLAALLEDLAGREEEVVLLEVANEAWQNGFPGRQGIADLREFGAYLAARTAIPVALSATEGASDASLAAMYRGSAADIATEHFSRDLRTAERGWLPVRDPWRAGEVPGIPPAASNEPIGPGSSVAAENEPIRLVSAAIFAYLAGLPMYVFHSSAGVFGVDRFEDMAGARSFARLRSILPPDLPGWVRNDGLQAEAPFTALCDGRADAYWTEAPGAASGCHRCCGATKGREFLAFPMGILPGGVELRARRPLALRAVNPLDGTIAFDGVKAAGERLALPGSPGAFIILGTFR
jgi:hypothetical protein